ncbi:hypothetical protein [Streptomyces sp. NPDC050428]|uniref:hypothetical protein n=1 Tax=Streptomyces sp. NPDC050428 TaxID=3155757 RepID=UPI0034316564
MEEHRADTDAETDVEREEAPRDDASDLRDRLGRLEQVVAEMAAEAAVRGGGSVSANPTAGEDTGADEADREPVDSTVEAEGPATAELPVPEAAAEAEPAIPPEPEPAPEPESAVSYNDSAPYDGTTRPKRLRRVRWALAGSGVCCAVVLGGAMIGGGSAPPWLSIPGVTENSDDNPANSPPAPADSVSGDPGAGPGEPGVPGPGDATRSGGAHQSTAGAWSAGSGSPVPGPTPTDAVSPSATSGSPSAPAPTDPPSSTGGTGSGGSGTGAPSHSDEPTDPPPDDHDPLGGLLGGLFGN